MMKFWALSPGPGEPTHKTSNWDPPPAFIANTHSGVTRTIISVPLALSRVTSAHVN